MFTFFAIFVPPCFIQYSIQTSIRSYIFEVKAAGTFSWPFARIQWWYCNVDDKALLGNDSVKQQWKRSNRCYAMAQYTHVNNGDEGVFCVVGAVVISRVWSQFQITVTTEKSASLVRASNLQLNAFPKTTDTSNSLKYGACSVKCLEIKAQTHFQHCNP
jgi:hypothetical protein